MAELFGILTNDPTLLRCQLHRMRDSVHFDGEGAIGVGSYDDASVLMSKRPPRVGPRDLALLTEGVQSPALLASGEGVDAYSEEAVGPFRYRSWLFGMAGEVEGYDRLREGMESALPVFLQRALRTMTEGERVFSLFLKELHEHNQLDDPDLEGQEAARSLGRAIHALDALSERAGGTRPSRLALVATNGRIFAAARRGQPLAYLLTEGSGVCELCDLDEKATEGDPRIKPHRRARSVALGGGPTPGSGFVEIPDGSLVKVGRSLEINVSSL